jgi:RNA polymerase sigma-70 factor, ECF subfamily
MDHPDGAAMELTREGGDAPTVADQALVARAGAGDASAFAELIAPRLERLLRTARAILGNEADARDATQDACVAAWIKLPRLRDVGRFDAWLGRVLLNRCRDLLRARLRSREIDLTGIDLIDLQPDLESGATDHVMAAFDRLSLANRNILIQHHLHDRPLAEIAGGLGIPVGTAKSRLHAARRALERALEAQA